MVFDIEEEIFNYPQMLNLDGLIDVLECKKSSEFFHSKIYIYSLIVFRSLQVSSELIISVPSHFQIVNNPILIDVCIDFSGRMFIIPSKLTQTVIDC